MSLRTLPQGVQPNSPYIKVEGSTISFTLQDGPIREVGVNGCQIDQMIQTVREILQGLNAEFPCRENSCAITKLQEGEMWLRERTRDRTDRGVEGTNQP